MAEFTQVEEGYSAVCRIVVGYIARGRQESTHTHRHNLSVSLMAHQIVRLLTLRQICRLGATLQG